MEYFDKPWSRLMKRLLFTLTLALFGALSVHAEFMTKNSTRFASTGGWGYARWLGQDQKPYGKDASFTQECVACHTPVKDNDWVFTHPVRLP